MYLFHSAHPRIRQFPHYFRMKSKDKINEFYEDAKIHNLVWCQDFMEILGAEGEMWLLFKKAHHAVIMKLTYGGA